MGLPWRDDPAWHMVKRLSDATGRDLAGLLTDADAETLKATRNAQLATFALSLVILEAARAAGLADSAGRAVAGHSLGEYTALVAAGVLAPEEGARLVMARGEAMQAAADAHPGTMAAVLGLDAELVAQACQSVEEAWPANDNAPGQVVIAGSAQGVAAAGAAAKQLGAKRVMPLSVGGAFHSPLMAGAQGPLDQALAAARVRTGLARPGGERRRRRPPGGVGGPALRPVGVASPLARVAAHPGRLGVTHFLELGPGTELSGMVKRTVAASTRASVATPDDLGTLGGFLEGAGAGAG